jgi:hypothetical protein
MENRKRERKWTCKAKTKTRRQVALERKSPSFAHKAHKRWGTLKITKIVAFDTVRRLKPVLRN